MKASSLLSLSIFITFVSIFSLFSYLPSFFAQISRIELQLEQELNEFLSIEDELRKEFDKYPKTLERRQKRHWYSYCECEYINTCEPGRKGQPGAGFL